MATFDLNILPIHRVNNQELDSLPGLLAVTPPRRTARGREKDNLIVYLMLSGNAPLSNAELKDLNNKASGLFYQSAGPLTSAMRKVTESINTVLLERNRSTTGRGQYALALLVLAAVRESQCTLLLSGPTHAVWVSEGQSRHIHDAALSGKGLGSSQSIQTYFSQVELHPQDLLVLCGKFPRDWEADLLNERPPASLDASYRKLTFTKGDLHAALIQSQAGNGTISILRPDLNRPRSDSTPPLPVLAIKEPASLEASPISELPNTNYREASPRDQSPITEDELDEMADFAAHMVQPSAYPMPPLPADMIPLPEEMSATEPGMRGFPTSFPRTSTPTKLPDSKVDLEVDLEEEAEVDDVTTSARVKSDKPSAHAEAARQMAKAMAGGIQTGRRMNERAGTFFQKFIPRLLPNANSKKPLVVPTYVMIFIAVVIPAVVVTMASVIYLRFGQSIQYDELYRQALAARAQADGATDPVRQRDGWQSVLLLLNSADEYRETDESKLLRSEAQAKLDTLMGVVRLEFNPAFASGISGSTQISRMAASESDLYMLDAERGSILHAAFTGRSLELDSSFNCQPGTYAGYQVDTMVDLLALPKVNTVGANVLGIDPKGNLLYCSPGQVPQAIPLPALPNTNWGRITAFALDNGSLYVLDATSRAVWVFIGKDGTFVDTPYFYFSNQIPNIDNAIDLAVSGDDLYLLHADGHLSTCTFSRIAATPTRCVDPATYMDPFPAHQDLNLFAQAHFTQMSLTNPPNPVILLLDSENQSVFRFTPRSLELQNQVTGYASKENPFQQGSAGAMAVSPNYVLYIAIGNQVYFATNLP
ncbi:MAG TPA: hypothetical protein VNA23_09185 [Anaerolineales bacterium]|nr:hypothetical protein [Anaerolineales bacterium]